MNGVVLWSAVALASAAGACLRFVVDTAVTAWTRGGAPWGTAVVNLGGTFVAGVLAGAALGHGPALVVGVGLLGSYTTFSTWMLEVATLARLGRERAAVINLGGQLVAGMALAALGWMVGAGL